MELPLNTFDIRDNHDDIETVKSTQEGYDSIYDYGESVEAMAKVLHEKGTGSVELPFDNEGKFSVGLLKF